VAKFEKDLKDRA
jgi:hypothetical protein